MIRKSAYVIFMLCFVIGAMAPVAVGAEAMTAPVAVSYTHLTLPTRDLV